MSAASQQLFKHGIAREPGKCMRISLTFRDLIHPHEISRSLTLASTDISLDLSAIETTLTSTPCDPSSTQYPMQPILHPRAIYFPSNPNEAPTKIHESVLNPSEKPVETIFISSSMFANLDESKLSSEHHKVKILFYRGATAGGILSRLKNDPEFRAIKPEFIKQVYMLCGTNDVDNILNIQKNMHSNVNVDSSNLDMNRFNRTIMDIQCLVDFIHEWSNGVRINILNILPRASIHRNYVINKINQGIIRLYQKNTFVSKFYKTWPLCVVGHQ